MRGGNPEMDYSARFRPNKTVIFLRLEVYKYKWFGIARGEIRNWHGWNCHPGFENSFQNPFEQTHLTSVSTRLLKRKDK